MDAYCDLELRKVIDVPMRCDIPMSYGMIVWCRKTHRWLMMRRKHTVHFLALLRARYPLSYTYDIITNLTKEEFDTVKNIILNGYQYYISVMDDVYGNSIKSEDGHVSSWNHIVFSLSLIKRSIDKIESSNHIYPTLPYLWAKGYKIKNETGLQTACRELFEESGIDLPENVDMINQPIEYSRTGIMGLYNVTCWISIIDDEILLPPINPNDNEISDRRWMYTDECNKSMTKEENKILLVVESILKPYMV